MENEFAPNQGWDMQFGLSSKPPLGMKQTHTQTTSTFPLQNPCENQSILGRIQRTPNTEFRSSDPFTSSNRNSSLEEEDE